MKRPWRVALGAVVVAATTAGTATAGPTLLTTRPELEPQTGDFAFFVGGFSETGRSLKASSIELLFDNEKTPVVPSMQPLSEWAAIASEGGTTWRPPLAVGLVYLWVEGVPSGVLDGIHAFFQRLPSRTSVYATVYGRMRQGRARLTASEISRLDEVPHLEGDRPNLLDAVRLDMGDLGAEKVPLKLLLIVTDGRDFADPKGEASGDFNALGRDLRRAGITPVVVGFPPPAADAVSSTANLGDLHATGGGFLRILEQSDDLENTLESLGQAVGDLNRVRFSPPSGWQIVGGAHRVAVRLTTTTGKHLSADAGSFDVRAGLLVWIGAGAGGLLLVIVVVLVAVRRRRPEDEDEPDVEHDVLAAAHDLVRRGTPPDRAVEELARMFPGRVRELVELDEELLDDPRYPYFRTRPGRLRLGEMRDLLANKRVDKDAALPPALADLLAKALNKNLQPQEIAERIIARTTTDDWTGFAGLSLDALAERLRVAAYKYAVLGTPRARGVAVAVQDELRVHGAERGVAIGWLVRTHGLARRGETFRLRDGANVIGSAASSTIRLADEDVAAAEHAQISSEAGEFAIRSVGGAVTVEGKPIGNERHVLTDGETIGVGRGLFVFKCAIAGNVGPQPHGRGQRRDITKLQPPPR